MILSGEEIKARLGKDIKISPFHEEQVNPNSYNLQLFPELKVYRPTSEFGTVVYLDSKRDNPTKTHKIPEEGFCLRPGTLYLGRTVEWTETQNLVPILTGRSSMARLGVAVHVTAGFGDVGYCGYWTLEITCVHPVKVYPNQKVCQIFYHHVSENFVPYQGKYQGTAEILPSRMHTDFHSKDDQGQS